MAKSVAERETPNLLKTLGAHVRALREERGWSQEELGERSGGMNKETVNRVENGRNTTISTILRLGLALNVPLGIYIAGTVGNRLVLGAPRPPKDPGVQEGESHLRFLTWQSADDTVPSGFDDEAFGIATRYRQADPRMQAVIRMALGIGEMPAHVNDEKEIGVTDSDGAHAAHNEIGQLTGEDRVLLTHGHPPQDPHVEPNLASARTALEKILADLAAVAEQLPRGQAAMARGGGAGGASRDRRRRQSHDRKTSKKTPRRRPSK